MSSTITVRRALPGDIPWLVSQLRDFDVMFGAGRSLFPGEAKACEILAHLIGEHVFLVALMDTKVTLVTGDCVEGPRRIGFIAGHIGAHPYAGFTVLTELFWWVVPASRGTRAGSLLLDRYIAAGRQLCAKWILMTLEHDSPVSDRVLTKRGFHHKESSYLMEVA